MTLLFTGTDCAGENKRCLAAQEINVALIISDSH
jgi:hypothetical protein